MKVVGINGSPRKGGNTSILIETVFEELAAEGIETQALHIGGKRLRGCVACKKCFEKKDGSCFYDDDMLNECVTAMRDADGIILGSPTYFTDVTADMKALIDRSGFVSKANGDFLKRKVGAAVVAARRGGSIQAFDTINHFFTITQMIVPGSNYWNLGIGLDKGDVRSDQEGLQTMRVLGQNMAWLLKKISA